MKTLIIIALLAICVSCNSGKNKPADKQAGDTTTTVTPSDTTIEPTTPAGKIDIETFGDTKVGQPSSATLKALGEPDKKSKAQEWGADGLMHEDWTWKSKGLVLNMSSEKGNPSSMTVFSITAEAPCDFKTRAGISIGSKIEDVQAAYKRDINTEESSKDQITVGSVYGGIIFTIAEGKVSHIFLGADAE